MTGSNDYQGPKRAKKPDRGVDDVIGNLFGGASGQQPSGAMGSAGGAAGSAEPGPQQSSSAYMTESPVSKILGVGGLAVVALLAFVAPWVSLQVNGERLATITLSRRVTADVGDRTAELSGGVNWVFVLLMIALAIAAWRIVVAQTSTVAAEVASGAGLTLVAYFIFSWLGRSLWLNSGLPDGLSLHMSWGYYVALVIGVALIFVPSMFTPDHA